MRLLAALARGFEGRVMVDVGAERGAFADGMLAAGIDALYAIEPHPDNARSLRERFAGDRRVAVYEYAASDADGSGELHVSADPDGKTISFGHTLLVRSDTDEIAWSDSLQVTRRSLASLIEEGALPARTSILKIDTEGHDLEVLRGMGALDCDVVMLEHWLDLPHGLGACPWSAAEIIELLAPRGFSHFALIAHRGEFTTLQWDDAELERGAVGNLIFLHDRVCDRLMPQLLECTSRLAAAAVKVGQMYMEAANERLELVSRLHAAAHAQQVAFEASREAR